MSDLADAFGVIPTAEEERAMTTSSEYPSEPTALAQPIPVVAPSGYYVPSASRLSDRWPWVAVVLIAGLAAVAVALIMAMGNHQRPGGLSTVAQVAAKPSASPKVITRTVRGPSTTIIREEAVSTSAPAAPVAASGSCGSGISVNGQTSCPFAQNVVQQYTEEVQQEGAPSSFDVYAYSPVTGQSYTDLCSYGPSNAVVSCSHGSDLIQFAYGSVAEPVSTSAPAHPISASGSCGSGISVNGQTSCAFAQNVVQRYTEEAQQAGAPRSFDVAAFSTVTGKSYTDSCGYSWSTGIVSCSHGSDLVQFAYGPR
jgi:hypothetical protein